MIDMLPTIQDPKCSCGHWFSYHHFNPPHPCDLVTCECSGYDQGTIQRRTL